MLLILFLRFSLEKCEKKKIQAVWLDRGNTAWADMVGLGSIGLKCLGTPPWLRLKGTSVTQTAFFMCYMGQIQAVILQILAVFLLTPAVILLILN